MNGKTNEKQLLQRIFFFTETQIINVITRTAYWMKNNKVPLVIEFFNAIHYKLLQTDIKNSNNVMVKIHNNRFNTLLRNVHEVVFNQQSLLKIAIFLEEARRKPTGTYTTPLQDASHLNTTYNDKESDYSNTTTDTPQRGLLNVALEIGK